MATVVKTQRPEDFLALVPQLAGFRPHNSIIIVAFRGNRTCAAMRFTLPDADAGASYSTVAARLIGIACKVRGADAVVPVVYTDDRFADTGSIPHAGFVRAVIDRARTAGFLVRDALCVAEDGWGSYLDEDCPHDGRPLAAIESSSVNGAIPRELRNDLGPVDAGSELPTVDLATQERVARLLQGLNEYARAPRDLDVTNLADPALANPELIEPEIFDPDAIAPEWDDDGWDDDAGDADDDLPRSGWLLGFAEDALQFAPDSIGDRAAAVLILCLQSPMMRDVMMLQWAFGLEVGELALEENERYLAGEDPEAFLVAPLMWGNGPRPDVQRVWAAIALVKALAARAPRSMRPSLLCQLAWFNWALGKSSLAARFVDAAQLIDANFGLAELLHAMLEAGHLPEWAFAIPDDAVTP